MLIGNMSSHQLKEMCSPVHGLSPPSRLSGREGPSGSLCSVSARPVKVSARSGTKAAAAVGMGGGRDAFALY